jgi:predicted esterase
MILLAALLITGLSGAAIEDVAFTAGCDGTPQRYVLVLPESFAADHAHDVMIALHGHGSDRWQFVNNPRDECRAARDFAVKRDMIYVSPDYRASTSWMGPKAEADLVQIIAGVKKRFSVRRVFLCGGSMGAASTLTFAVLHPELLDGVAAMNGTANHVEYANFQDAIAESFGGNKNEKPDEYRKRSAEFFPERLTMPVGLTAGGKDESVPPQSVTRLADALKKMVRKVLLVYRETGGHETCYADAMTILEFMAEGK